jgi:hypothetical protein
MTMTTSHSDGFSALIHDLAVSQARDLSGVAVSNYPSAAEYPRHDAPGMLYRIEGNGAKSCCLCGLTFPRTSQGYHSHAAKHIREGLAEPIVTRLYRRWYALTGPGLIHYASRED